MHQVPSFEEFEELQRGAGTARRGSSTQSKAARLGPRVRGPAAHWPITGHSSARVKNPPYYWSLKRQAAYAIYGRVCSILTGRVLVI
jgi:hypothetical protein